MDPREIKKRRRERIIILITLVVIFALTYVESHLSQIETLLPSSSDVLIFGLININLILVILLIFLIVRNLVKLIFERKKGILGSKVRTKLVVAFVSLSLIPTVVLFMITIKFLSYNIENWFEMRLGNALDLSLNVAQEYYQQQSDNALYYARKISLQITENKLYEQERLRYLTTILENERKDFNLSALEIYFDNRKENIFIKDSNDPDIGALNLTPKIREEIFMGKDLSMVQSMGGNEVVRGIAPLYSNFSPREVIGVVSASYLIKKNLVDKMAIISRTSEEYKQLRLLKNPIKISYIITLSIVTLLITFSATWFGLFIAKGITEPIQDLAEATHEVANGNLDYHIDLLAEDEIGVLVESFNSMTRDLKKNSEELKRANVDLDQRRNYMETVLRNVSAGVISIDEQGRVTTINSAAEKILAINTGKVVARKYINILDPTQRAMVDEFLEELRNSPNEFLQKQVELTIGEKWSTMLVSATILRNESRQYMGIVAVFEDITHLRKAERMAAWREVARRIAHEIKNPLTPVKLSAERLQRRYGDKMTAEDNSIFNECTKTIINQVDVLKNLVNEFSRFARMPVTNPKLNDLNAVIEETLFLFKDTHREIGFEFAKDSSLPPLNIDAEQIRRVMINLLDNAIAALKNSANTARIEIVTLYDKESKRARVSVIDNGHGISPEDKMRLFEPYFSTKKTGTGLGLAIVDSIISDHNGTIRVQDNEPVGTIITFELPII